jgi:hypothetical protein
LFQVVSIQPSERWTCAMRNASMRPLKASATPLTRAHALLDAEVLGRQLDRVLDHPNQVEVQTLEPATAQLAWTKTTSGPSPS